MRLALSRGVVETLAPVRSGQKGGLGYRTGAERASKNSVKGKSTFGDNAFRALRRTEVKITRFGEQKESGQP